MPPRARRSLHWTVLALFAASLGVSAARAHEAHAAPSATTAPTPGSYALPAIRPAPEGRWLDAAGHSQSLHALFDQRIVVLSLIYTHCADGKGCPMASYTLGQVAKRIAANPELKDTVRFISLSFDPARDTTAVLAEYAGHFRPANVDWQFVPADPAQLTNLLEGYRQDLAQGGGELAHTLRLFLIDRKRRIRNEYTADFLDPALLLADIETLALAPEAPQAPAATVARSILVRAGDQRGGYETDTYASDSRALTARAAAPLDLVARLEHGERGLPAMPGPRPGALQVQLGRKLFFDRRLSLNDTLACASCHVPEQGYASNELKTPVGIEGRSVRRNAPGLMNVGFQPHLFHDARESKLEQQIWGPLLASNEMGNPSIGFLLEKIAALKDYSGRFEQAFGGTPVDMQTLGAALAAYQRTLIAGDSAFDRWRAGVADAGFSPEAQRGHALFTGKAGCVACHLIGRKDALFTDFSLHNTGIGFRQSMQSGSEGAIEVTVAPGERLSVSAEDRGASGAPVVNDLGRYEVTLDPADRWRFRTPSLRNVALTAPYMHDGSVPDLPAVVAFYNAGGVPNDGLDPRVKPLGLTGSEETDLVAFLQSLTGNSVPALIRDAWAVPIGDRQRR